MKSLTGINISSDVLVKDPHLNITVLNSFCTTIVIYMFINLMMPLSMIQKFSLQYHIKKEYAVNNNGYCKLPDKLLIVKLKDGSVLAEENKSFKIIQCNKNKI